VLNTNFSCILAISWPEHDYNWLKLTSILGRSSGPSASMVYVPSLDEGSFCRISSQVRGKAIK
jgi:hypothetical protein